MRKVMKTMSLFIMLGIALLAFGCDNKTKDPVIIESISVVSESIPDSILTTEIDDKIDDIKINVLKSDDSSSTVNVSKDMISSSDYESLSTEGTHEITITYEGFTTTVTIVTVKPNDKEDTPTNEPTKEPQMVEYSVIVKDIAGKPLHDFYVTFYLGNDVVAEGYTNNLGTFSKELEADYYDVLVEGREGYFLNTEMFETDLIGTPIEVTCEIDSLKDTLAPQENYYQLGDVMYDFTVVNTSGEELKLYDLLEEYKVVILNFWYTTCSACYYEFPYMVEAYESQIEGSDKYYKDEVCIIAVNPGTAGNQDTMEDIKSFKESMNLSFDVAMDYDYDTTNLTADPALNTMFSVTGYPTTVVIDSFGLIADIEVGAVTATEKWTQTFDKYIGDDYYPVYTGEVSDDDYIKPDIVQEDSSVLEAAINGTNYDGSKFTGTYDPEDNKDAELSWPWIVEEFDGKSCIRPSNIDINPSFAIVYTTIQMKKGEVLTFDYFASTEEYDALYITANGVIATQISGMSPYWEKSYCYVALEDEEVEFGFVYLKDGSYSSGEDGVFITNMRLVQIKDIDKETYIFRECATGSINEFTMSYPNYAEVFYNEEDGYYHVGSVDGALLMADMLSGTQWNLSTLYEISLEGKCIGADGVDYNALVEEYSVYASNSSIGYTPVTKELADALKQIVKALGDEAAVDNLNQWLEVCVYYSAYGTNGVELGLPTIGVCPFEPIMLDGDGITTEAVAEATFDRIILPRGFIFGFTPTKSGVYKFYTTEEVLETYTWICDNDANVIGEAEYELRIFAANSSNNIENDKNATLYAYLEEGKTYLFRAAFYDPFEYSTISVAMSYVNDSVDLLTVASPGPFTTSDDEMTNIISGNYIDVTLGDDGYYHVVNSKSSDDFVYCDMTYINNITGYSLLDCLSDRFNAFDFSKDEFGRVIYDENGYYLYTSFDENNNIVQYYVCYDEAGEMYYVTEIGADGYTEENGYTYIKFTPEELEDFASANCTEYVTKYVEENMITDESSELYGCVKVDERFAYVLGMLMDKYTFAGVEGSWLKLCYYYKHVGA